MAASTMNTQAVTVTKSDLASNVESLRHVRFSVQARLR